MKYKILIQLLLSCTCILEEERDSLIDYPVLGEERTCQKHGKVTIMKMSNTFKVLDKKKPNL